MVREFGWSRAQVTSGNAISKLVVGPLFGFPALPLALFVPEAPPAAAGTPTPDPRAAGPASIRTVLRAPAFYLLLAGSMCSIAAVGGTNQHLKLFLSLDHGYSQAAAAQIASLVLVSSLAGRLGMGWLPDRMSKKYVMLLIYGLVASAIPLLFLTGTPGASYLFTLAFWLGLGGEYMVI